MRSRSGIVCAVVLASGAGIIGNGCGGSIGVPRKDAGGAPDVAIAFGGVPGAGGLTLGGGTGGAKGTGSFTAVVGGSARGGSTAAAAGGTGAVGVGGAGGVGGSVTVRPDASVPDVPGGGEGFGTGGRTSTGGAIGNGGAMGSGGATGVGGITGAGGSPAPVTGPCDIYAAASPPTPCAAAYSMVRVLLSTYTGPLYQVRRGAGLSNTGAGGTTQDIRAVDGYADADAQETFCASETCTVSKLYDQTGNGNHLTVAKKGCLPGTASEDDYESSATKRSLQVNGHKVYALYMGPHEGYRNNQTTGMPTGSAAQGIYEVVDGRRYDTACCWEFGNASTDNCYAGKGKTNALFFGAGIPGVPEGKGPWFLGDFGTGPWMRDCGFGDPEDPCYPASVTDNFAVGMLKTDADSFEIRVGNAQSGRLQGVAGGDTPFPIQAMAGGIILGIDEANSNSSQGTFLEGAITAGWPSNATDDAVLLNVQAAAYGQ